MATRQLTLGLGDAAGEILGHRVYTRESWLEDWTLQEYVHCSQANWTTGDQLPTATLYYVYGWGALDGNAIQRVNPFTLPTMAYVKIEFDVQDLEYDPEGEGDPVITLTWYGLAGTLIDQTGGISINDTEDPPKPVPQGVQQFQCVGMIWRLMQLKIHETVWLDGGTVKRSPGIATFNARGEGNKTASEYDQVSRGYTSPVFHELNNGSGTDWSVKTIVQYLLAEMRPFAGSGSQHERWKLTDPDNLLPTWASEPLDPTDQSIAELLTRLMSPQRGFGFVVDVEPEEGYADLITVTPFTYAASDITIGTSGGRTIPENPNLIELTIHSDRGASVPVVTDAMSRFDVVRVLGAEATYTFTLDGFNNLRKDWSTSEETAYVNGASGEVGFPASTELAAQQRWMRRARQAPDLRHVWRHWHVFEGFAGTSVGIDEDAIGIPALDNFASAAVFYPPLARLANESALIWGADYSADNLPTIDDRNGYRPHGAYHYDSDTTEWVNYAERGNNRDLEDGVGKDPRYFVNISPRDTYEPIGMLIEVIGGQPHDIDRSNFTGHSSDNISGTVPGLSWRQMQFTVTVTTGERCYVRRPTTGLSGFQVLREKRIEAGNDFRLDFVADGTIVGVDINGDPLERTQADYVRDDRDALEDIADLALAWYSDDRRAIEFTTSHVNGSILIGQMITILAYPVDSDIDDIDVNTVVTKIQLDIPWAMNSPQQLWRMAYSTNLQQLNAVGLIVDQRNRDR